MILLLFPKTNECRPRSRAQRRRDAEQRLAHDADGWVASAPGDAAPYLDQRVLRPCQILTTSASRRDATWVPSTEVVLTKVE